MIAIFIELSVILLLAWSITYITYKYHVSLSKLSIIKSKILIEKKEVDRITNIFYRYFYIYIMYFIISNFIIISYVENKIIFHSIGVIFSIFFLYIQTYVIHRWKMILKLIKI